MQIVTAENPSDNSGKNDAAVIAPNDSVEQSKTPEDDEIVSSDTVEESKLQTDQTQADSNIVSSDSVEQSQTAEQIKTQPVSVIASVIKNSCCQFKKSVCCNLTIGSVKCNKPVVPFPSLDTISGKYECCFIRHPKVAELPIIDTSDTFYTCPTVHNYFVCKKCYDRFDNRSATDDGHNSGIDSASNSGGQVAQNAQPELKTAQTSGKILLPDDFILHSYQTVLKFCLFFCII